MNEKPTENPSLSSLDAQLEALKKTQKPAPQPGSGGDAARAAIDFASASATGCALGYGADYLFHSAPWGLLAGLLIGVVAGFCMMMGFTIRDIKAKQKPNE